MIDGLEQAADNLRDTIEGVTRSLGLVASDLSIVAQMAEDEKARLQQEIEHLNHKLELQKQANEVSNRNKERFRYALWVYLQERDGPAGTRAPTPETLKLIRELIQELQ